MLRSDCGGSPHFANKPFILCTLIMLALGWVVLLSGIEGHAAEAPSAIPGTASPTISPSEKTTAEIESLVRQLEDPSERAALIGRLRLLLQSRKEGLAGKGTSSPQTAHSYARAIQKVNQTITAGLKSLYTVLPTLRLFFGKLQGFSDPEAFFSLLRLSIAVAFSLFLMYLVRRFFHKFLPAETVDPPSGGKGKTLSAARRWINRFLPSGALLVAGSLIVALLGLQATAGEILLILLWAIFFQRFLAGFIIAVLAPERPQWRIFLLSDETAAYLSLWARRFIFVAVWGLAFANAADTLRLGPEVVVALLTLYQFILFLQALVLIVQQRDRVREFLFAREPEGAGRTVRLALTAWNITVTRWHIIAVAYLLVFFFLWATESSGGVRFLLSSTAITVAIAAAAFALTRLVRIGTSSLFAVSDRMKSLVPGIEKRANLYTPLVAWVFDSFIWVVAILLVLDAWGVPTFAVLFSEPGLILLGSFAGIAMTVAVATGAIEITRVAIDYILSGRRDEQGEVIEASGQQRTLLPLGFAVIKWTIISIVIIIILGNLGVNIGPVLAGAGILGLAIGFGAQSLVKDVITGVFMLIEGNVAVGDVVKVKGIGGLVEGFNLRSVCLRDYHGNVHVIPNSAIDVVTNFTKEYSRRVFDIGVAYKENVDEVIEVIRQVDEEMRSEPEWADKILEPVEIAGLDEFGDSALVIRGRFKTKPIQQWNVGREFNRRIKKAFDERGIEIPFPYRTLTWGTPKEGSPPSPSRDEESTNKFPSGKKEPTQKISSGEAQSEGAD